MSGASEIYIEGSPAERRAGHLDADGNAIALDVERPTRPRIAESIHRARVRTVDKRTQAAFLDLGKHGDAILSKAKDLSEGAPVDVQITRDAHDDKGAAAGRQIVLWGRYVALQPGRGGGLQCAKALGQGKRRAETLAAAEAVLDDPTDLLLRGPASAVDAEILAEEAARLRAEWAEIDRADGKPPLELRPAPDFIDLILREAGPAARVALDDRLDYARARDLGAARYPDLEIAFHDAPEGLFDGAGLSDVMVDALSEEVPLHGGGRLTIQETRALTAIDVDMGAGEAGGLAKEEAIHRLNRRAAEEIVRQIALRRISGLISIDFVGLMGKKRMTPLLDILRSRVKALDGHVDVLGVSPAGMVEITRQRVGPTLADLYLTLGARRPSPDAEAAEVLRRALRLRGAGRPTAALSEAAAKLLDGPLAAARAETEKRLGQALDLRRGAAKTDVFLER
jgi:ribonuclease G